MNIYRREIMDSDGGTGPVGSIPDDAEIIHTQLMGRTGPLVVFYGVDD